MDDNKVVSQIELVRAVHSVTLASSHFLIWEWKYNARYNFSAIDSMNSLTYFYNYLEIICMFLCQCEGVCTRAQDPIEARVWIHSWIWTAQHGC